MKVKDYAARAAKTDRLKRSGGNRMSLPLVGISAETGLLLAEVQREVRLSSVAKNVTPGSSGNASIRLEVRKKLGNIIWYACAVSGRVGLDMSRDVLYPNLIDILVSANRLNRVKANLRVEARSWDAYQRRAWTTSGYSPTAESLVKFFTYMSRCSADLVYFSKYQRLTEARREKLAERLGAMLWYVAGFATLFGLKLSDVATANLGLVEERYRTGRFREPTPLYDSEAVELEKLPRRFKVKFVEGQRIGDGTHTATMLMNGVVVGDTLTDNSRHNDGYRFHDALHLANAAILGWSPVTRALLRRKRKHNPSIDEVDDGARATIVEEAIVNDRPPLSGPC